MNKIVLFIRKEFLQQVTYKFSFIFEFSEMCIYIALWYYIAKFFKGPQITNVIYGGDYFSFILIGIASYRYITNYILVFPINTIKEISMGTLESNWAAPVSPLIVTLYSSLWGLIFVSIQVALFLLIGKFAFGAHIQLGNFFPAIVVIILTLLSYASIGLVLASFALIFKCNDPLATIINSLFVFLGGVYFPTAILPRPLQQISGLFPITHSLNALRKIFIQGTPLNGIYPELIALAVFAALFIPLSVIIFNYTVKKVKLSGNLTFY